MNGTPTSGHNPTTGRTRIRVIHGGGIAIQQRWDDREQFMAILVQLRMIASRADDEAAEYYRRNLIQQAELMGAENLAVGG